MKKSTVGNAGAGKAVSRWLASLEQDSNPLNHPKDKREMGLTWAEPSFNGTGKPGGCEVALLVETLPLGAAKDKDKRKYRKALGFQNVPGRNWADWPWVGQHSYTVLLGVGST